MTNWNRQVCPVCRRLVDVVFVSKRVIAHADKCGRACPMSGREIS